MSSGLTSQEMAYLQSTLQAIWSSASGSLGDEGNALSQSIIAKAKTGQLSHATTNSFLSLPDVYFIDEGTF